MSSLAISVGVFAGDLVATPIRTAGRRHARIAGDDGLLGRAFGRLAVVSGEGPWRCLQAEELLIPLGDYREVAIGYSNAAYMSLIEDSFEEATSFLETALHAVGSIDDPFQTEIILSNIGLVRLFSGDLDHARDAFERALRLCAQHDFRELAGEGLAGLAAVAAAQGREETAARLRGAARALEYPPATLDTRIDDRLERDYLAAARTRYGVVAWDADERAGADCRVQRRSLTRSANEAKRSRPQTDRGGARAEPSTCDPFDVEALATHTTRAEDHRAAARVTSIYSKGSTTRRVASPRGSARLGRASTGPCVDQCSESLDIGNGDREFWMA